MRTFLRTSHDQRRRSSSCVPPPDTLSLGNTFLSVAPDLNQRRASAGSIPAEARSLLLEKRGSCPSSPCGRLTLNVPLLPRQPSSPSNEDKKHPKLKRLESRNLDIKTGSLLATIAVICMVIAAVLFLSYAIRNTWFEDLPLYLQ